MRRKRQSLRKNLEQSKEAEILKAEIEIKIQGKHLGAEGNTNRLPLKAGTSGRSAKTYRVALFKNFFKLKRWQSTYLWEIRYSDGLFGQFAKFNLYFEKVTHPLIITREYFLHIHVISSRTR